MQIKLIALLLISLIVIGCSTLPLWMDRCVVFSYEAIYGEPNGTNTAVVVEGSR